MMLKDGLAVELPMAELQAFCQRWQVQELALYGSVLRSDFRPDSDIDMMITLKNGPMTLARLDAMTTELEALLGRRVDLVTRLTVESARNYLLRHAILSTAQVIYAAG